MKYQGLLGTFWLPFPGWGEECKGESLKIGMGFILPTLINSESRWNLTRILQTETDKGAGIKRSFDDVKTPFVLDSAYKVKMNDIINSSLFYNYENNG